MSHPQPDSADHDMAHNSAHPFAKSAKGWGSLAGELILTFLKTDKPKTVAPTSRLTSRLQLCEFSMRPQMGQFTVNIF